MTGLVPLVKTSWNFSNLRRNHYADNNSVFTVWIVFLQKKITMNYPAASYGVARMALGLLIRSKLRGIRPGRDQILPNYCYKEL